MKLEKWWPWYNNIASMLGLNKEEDQRATRILSRLLMGRTQTPKTLADKIRGKTVVVFGAGPSLEKDLGRLMKIGFLERAVSMAADGATTALLKTGITPDLIVTDLDGRVEDILDSHRLGSIVVVHAHGDNIERLKSVVPKFTHRIFGTTQVKPMVRVHNFGGFTDGDRCVFLSERFAAKKIVLVGMDFGWKIGKYSKPNLELDMEISEIKWKKLQIAKKLIEWISTWAKAEILNFTSSGEEIRGVKKLHIRKEFFS